MKLLDLFCCGGGAAMGYHLAGFDEIVGVDIVKQKRYPFSFVQGDALKYLEKWGHLFDAIHASPPCQAYTSARHLRGYEHPDLIAPLRELLVQSGKPYVIENVPGAPLLDPIRLNGLLFDLKVVRERLFECSFPIQQPGLPSMTGRVAKMGRPPKEGEYISVVGHFSGVDYARKAMGIEWLGVKELAQAIPPAYTEWIGRHLIEAIKGES